jgi:hypothetical protein
MLTSNQNQRPKRPQNQHSSHLRLDYMVFKPQKTRPAKLFYCSQTIKYQDSGSHSTNLKHDKYFRVQTTPCLQLVPQAFMQLVMPSDLYREEMQMSWWLGVQRKVQTQYLLQGSRGNYEQVIVEAGGGCRGKS